MAQPEAINEQINHMSVKPPHFDESAPSRWFTILESQFVLSKITASQTKFHHVIANLPTVVMAQLTDTQIASNDYETIKNDVIKLFTKSSPELFDTIMSKTHITCTKPTLYLNELRKLANQANLGLSDEFLKIKFIKGVPDSIRPMLATHAADSLDELARVADTMLAYNPSMSVSHVPPPRDCTPNPSSFNQAHKPRITMNVKNFATDNIPYALRAFHATQKPQVCRAHLYYGNHARSCKPWCILFQPKLKILPNSRSNSPARTPSSSEN